ncbi:MAG: hypothetical protein RLZZ76_84, partial [Candidatus Parcubacteria bacterium]
YEQMNLEEAKRGFQQELSQRRAGEEIEEKARAEVTKAQDVADKAEAAVQTIKSDPNAGQSEIAQAQKAADAARVKANEAIAVYNKRAGVEAVDSTKIQKPDSSVPKTQEDARLGNNPTGGPSPRGEIELVKIVGSPLSVNGKPMLAQNKAGRNDEFGSDRPGDRIHAGVDIDGATGDVIAANRKGTVVRSDNSDPDGYGNTVDIKFDDGTVVRMSHLGLRSVEIGDSVEAGTKIGEIGRSGVESSAVPTHVHVETYSIEQYDNAGGRPRSVTNENALKATRLNPNTILNGDKDRLVAQNVTPETQVADTQDEKNETDNNPLTIKDSDPLVVKIVKTSIASVPGAKTIASVFSWLENTFGGSASQPQETPITSSNHSSSTSDTFTQ